MPSWLPRWLSNLVFALARSWPWLGRKLNALIINASVNAAPHRPNPYSTFSDYVCWTSLSDQHWSGRHLPPVPTPPGLPKPEDVVALFYRDEREQKLCPKSTCLFPAFAQYLTDGFIRTVMPAKGQSQELRRRNTSNHQIDMCPLYGRTDAQVAALRLGSSDAGKRGRLKSQVLNGEEYSPFLLDQEGNLKAEFASLDTPLGLYDIADPDKRRHIFATGGDRINASPLVSMINTLFLREHNRLAGELEARHPGWDDEHVFQVARNIVIVVFIKIVVEEYINHIAPVPFMLRADPSVAWNAPWNKPNWITTEFSLLYRWHSLIPDTLNWGKDYPIRDVLQDNRLLVGAGLANAFRYASGQRAARLGALNTARDLVGIELNAIIQNRVCDVAPYVAYRKSVSLPVPTRFEDISRDPDVVTALKGLYKRVEDIDFYAGLFAEDTIENSPLPMLIFRLVAIDAFSQALTNPLLSEHVFNADTFTPYGWDTINNTATLKDVLARNISADVSKDRITMTQPDWRYR